MMTRMNDIWSAVAKRSDDTAFAWWKSFDLPFILLLSKAACPESIRGSRRTSKS